jgi:hypothetical protein
MVSIAGFLRLGRRASEVIAKGNLLALDAISIKHAW